LLRVDPERVNDIETNSFLDGNLEGEILEKRGLKR